MSALPQWLVPMAATLTEARFAGPGWRFERKLDGIRLLAWKRGDAVRLYSRNRLEQDVPSIAEGVRRLPASELILDGEMEWDGRAYHVFDLLWRDGRSLAGRPLEERLAELDALPLEPPLQRVAAIDHPAPWELARERGWEGVIAKRAGSSYEHKRSKSWLKMKCEQIEELLVGGFTDPQGSRVGLGALLLGQRDGDDLVYAGKLGTGFDTELLLALRARLDRLEIPAPPFTRGHGLPRKGAHWVRPELTVRVAFIEWTGHRKLRHPRLLEVCGDRLPRPRP
jgi:bifunctional non-homologous end joining protein LigD